MKKKSTPLTYFLILWLSFTALAQPSIHEEQTNRFNQFPFENEAQFDSLRGASQISATDHSFRRGGNCQLQQQVYGWHPYWMGSAYNNYDFSLLSTISYFSYQVVPSTGNYSNIQSWKTTNLVNLAHAAGCRVELCVTNFGSTNNNTLLSNPTAQQTLIDSLISLVQYRNADGVNIDFEGIPGSQKTNFNNFMINLSNQMHAAIPGSSVSLALYAVDWSDVFDIPLLDQYVDQFIIMGYAYYWSGSSTAGPTALLYSGSIWWSYNLTRTVNYYINENITRSKLLLGLPYYGREWETAAATVPSSNLNSIGPRSYSWLMNNYEGTHTKIWDQQSFTYYYSYQTGGDWRQCFFDGKRSLGHRYDMVKDWGLGGIGIWALGYDDGHSELWDLIEEKFTDCGQTACTDTMFDMGGPFGQYRDYEDWTKTIAPDGATNVAITFNTFDVEAGYDFVDIYDGINTSAPLIGSYSGVTNPGTIVSSGPAITMHFTSDIGVRADGWDAIWLCDTYCPSVATNGNQEWIQSICVNTTCSHSGNNSGYGNYTHTNPKLKMGKAYALTLTPGFSGTPQSEQWRIWLDLNADFSFDDANELLFETTTPSIGPVTGTFTIPYVSYEGPTRLRVQMKRDITPGMCEEFQYGEVEDYGVRIVFSCNTPTGLNVQNIAGNSATLSWNSTSADTYLVKVRKAGMPNWFDFHSTLDSLPLQILQPNEAYEAKVKSICYSAGEVSGFSPVISFSTLDQSAKTAQDKSVSEKAKIWWNPFTSSIWMSVPESEEAYSVSIFALNGQTVVSKEFQSETGGSDFSFEINQPMPSGVYMVLIENAQYRFVDRVQVFFSSP